MESIVYLENLPVESTVNDIFIHFGKYGQIERVKFINQYADDVDIPYATGIALIKFAKNDSCLACVEDKNPIIINGHVVHVYNNAKPIRSRIYTSAFIRLKSIYDTHERICSVFQSFEPLSVQILHPVLYDRPGLAIVQFRTEKDRSIVIDTMSTDEFYIQAPQYELDELAFDEDDVLPSLIMEPPSLNYADITQFERFYDFEVKYNGQSYRVNSFLAANFSKRISDKISDETDDQSFSITCNITEKGPFDLIVKSLMGHEIIITNDNTIFLLQCAVDLGMDELKSACEQLINDFTNIEMVFRFAGDLCQAGLDYSRHVKYIAACFNLLKDDPSFKSLPLDVVASVLHELPQDLREDPAFPDWLLKFVGQNEEARSRLISFMPFNKMAGTSVRNILSQTGVNMNALRQPIMYLLEHGLAAEEETPSRSIACSYKRDRPTEGIFSKIKELNGRPASDIVQVTATSDLAMLLDPSWTGAWTSPTMPGMWVCFDLDARDQSQLKSHQAQRRFSVISYTLKTAEAQDVGHLKSWTLQGSNDMQRWEDLHVQTKCSALRGAGKFHTFDTSTQKPFRYVRLVMTGKNWSGTDSMTLMAIELYGELYMGAQMKKAEVFRYEKGKEWSGLFDWLSRTSIGNPMHSNEVFITTAASPSNLLDLEWQGYWRSPDTPNSFVAIGFPNMSVSLEAYSLRSATQQGSSFPQTWVVEGSDDSVQWSVIDQRKNRTNLLNPGKSDIFHCSPSKKFRYIRIKQNGENRGGRHTFALSHIELYGTLYLFE